MRKFHILLTLSNSKTDTRQFTVSLKGREFEEKRPPEVGVSKGFRRHASPGNFEILYFGNAIFSILRANQSGLIAVNSSQFFASKRTTMLIT